LSRAIASWIILRFASLIRSSLPVRTFETVVFEVPHAFAMSKMVAAIEFLS
jgi:hypothetical protein